MEFDLGLAVREDSENPVYYVQYAHARICSLLRALETDGVYRARAADLAACCPAKQEKALIKQIAQYCEVVKLAARDYDPSHINRYLQELAGLLPPVLYRLPHQGRGASGGCRPSQAGGRYPHGAEERPEAHRRGCPREDVRTFEVTQASLRKCADSR